jgi:hypothetical protein
LLVDEFITAWEERVLHGDRFNYFGVDEENLDPFGKYILDYFDKEQLNCVLAIRLGHEMRDVVVSVMTVCVRNAYAKCTEREWVDLTDDTDAGSFDGPFRCAMCRNEYNCRYRGIRRTYNYRGGVVGGGRCKRLTNTSSGAPCCCWLTTG